ncbi:hypothetical protein FRX31_003499 [Thalictrum thalictroides]|uniref:Reverse transcriptase zinc-binding domain-containing protein n=1 Tax=Thalictrum thalictroides TaxID=46969 RepID=A0A7J6XD82_THATH|nr:hypothetical protein FRX31_003499 [Thalictrum thalictroides]
MGLLSWTEYNKNIPSEGRFKAKLSKYISGTTWNSESPKPYEYIREKAPKPFWSSFLSSAKAHPKHKCNSLEIIHHRIFTDDIYRSKAFYIQPRCCHCQQLRSIYFSVARVAIQFWTQDNATFKHF